MDFLWLAVLSLSFLYRDDTLTEAITSFKEQSSYGRLRNFVFDSHTNSIYVGSINTLYWLSSELKLINSLELGPQYDSVNCSFNPHDACQSPRVSTTAVSQALAIDARNRVLISCSTLYYGSCRTVDMRGFVPKNYFYRPMVSNDPNSSVVMFAGTGIEAGGVLYVGASYSTVGLPAYRDLMNMISVRNLASLDLSSKTFPPSLSSVVNLLPHFRANFDVKFVSGFQHKNHAYFLVNHPDSFSSSELASHVMRICRDDPTIKSFFEIRLECKVHGKDYRYARDATLSTLIQKSAGGTLANVDVIFGVFTQDSNEKTVQNSAICVFSIDGIEHKFQEAVQKCIAGQSFTGPAFITKPLMCSKKSNIQVPRSYCSFNHSLSSSSPISPISTALITDSIATSILVENTDRGTLAYVGLQSGTIRKLMINRDQNISPNNNNSIKLKQDTASAVKDMIFGLNNNLYVLTDKEVFSVKTFECGVADTCHKCLLDPHCGWCVSSRRCSQRSVCNLTASWLSETCPLIIGVSQSYISHNVYRTTSVVVTVNIFPTSHKNIECRMEDKATGSSEITKASVERNSIITCSPFSRSPHIHNNRTHVNLSLSVLVDKTPWITTSIHVYNCNHILHCSSCTTAVFSCAWCAIQHKCTARTDDCPTTDGISTRIIESKLCPRVELSSESPILLIASGKKASFILQGLNIPKIYQDKLKCRLRLGSHSVFSRAVVSLTASTPVRTLIICDPVQLDYSGNKPFVMVPLDVVWTRDLPLDRSDNLEVRIYKCRHLVSSCGQCLLLDPIYKCGWCADHCSLEKDCHAGWMGRTYTCPNPQILSFSPPGGPLSARTRLTVKGINLGIMESELEVKVAGQKCAIIVNTYVPSESFTCLVSPVDVSKSGPVTVTVKGLYTATSPLLYEYKNPVFTGLIPKKGPCSGGSRLTLTGTNLDYGSSVIVMINQKSAQLHTRNATHIQLETPSQDQPISLTIKAKFDDAADVLLKDHFIYVEDPTVTSVDPKISLVSGGNIVDIRGASLNSAQTPLMIVYVGNENRTSACTASSPSFMQCPTPDLRDIDPEILDETRLDFGLVMDNVTQLLKIPKLKTTFKQITYFPTPAIAAIPSRMRYRNGEIIVLEDAAVLNKFRELEILVGRSKCDMIGDRGQQLTFRPPDKPIHMTDERALITISVGNFYQEIGFLNYRTFKPPLRLILGIVLGAGLPLIAGIIVLFVCCCRRRKQKKLAIYKKAASKLIERDERNDRHVSRSNSYSENNPTGAEMKPLKPRQKRLENKDVKDVVDKDDDDDDVDDIKGAALFFQELLRKMDNPGLRMAAQEVYIDRERIELGNLIGKGHFGHVFAASLRDKEMKNPKAVAVKTVEDTGLNSKVVENFLKEGVIMMKFDHPCVLSLLGISLGHKKEPMVVLPFMAHGDLRTYVKDKTREFTARQLLCLAHQVSEGMSYLSSLNFIHRDLAARNCMIDDKNQVKVADFGLSHELYDREYYSTKDHKAKLPIKWMALESLEDFIFTTKSDVWSFGVLLWELMSRGVTPYPDVEVFETRNYLASGRRLRKPRYCPDNIYNIMLDCWCQIPERRPTFNDLVNRIELLVNPQGQQQTNHDEPTTYMNIAEQESQDYLTPTSLA